MALTTTQVATAIANVLHGAGVAGGMQIIDVSQSSNVLTVKVAEPTLGSNPGEIDTTTRTRTVTVT